MGHIHVHTVWICLAKEIIYLYVLVLICTFVHIYAMIFTKTDTGGRKEDMECWGKGVFFMV